MLMLTLQGPCGEEGLVCIPGLPPEQNGRYKVTQDTFKHEEMQSPAVETEGGHHASVTGHPGTAQEARTRQPQET